MGLMIVKNQEEESDPDSFQPKSLLILQKVDESIFATRFSPWAEITNLLPPEQSGFRGRY